MAVGTESEYRQLRRDLGVDEAAFSNDDAEVYFVDAQERYPDDHAKLVAYTRVLVIQGLIPGVLVIGKYQQNQSVEDFTKVKDNLEWWLNYWLGKVAEAADIPETPGANTLFFTTAQGQRGR